MDWAAIDGSIFRETGRTPAEVDGLTLAEIAALCRAADEAGPGRVWSPEELAAHLEYEAALSPEDRLWATEVP